MRDYLAGVRVHDAQVVLAGRPLEHQLFHVAPRDGEPERRRLALADGVEKLLHVAQQLLRNALAGRVNANFHVRRREEHRRGKHAHADRLAEAAGRAHEHFLRYVRPVVALQDLKVLPRERAGRFELPENARARLEEVVVEQALVVAALPAAVVELRQSVAAALHAREARVEHGALGAFSHARPQPVAHHVAVLSDRDRAVYGVVQEVQDFHAALGLHHAASLMSLYTQMNGPVNTLRLVAHRAGLCRSQLRHELRHALRAQLAVDRALGTGRVRGPVRARVRLVLQVHVHAHERQHARRREHEVGVHVQHVHGHVRADPRVRFHVPLRARLEGVEVHEAEDVKDQAARARVEHGLLVHVGADVRQHKRRIHDRDRHGREVQPPAERVCGQQRLHPQQPRDADDDAALVRIRHAARGHGPLAREPRKTYRQEVSGDFAGAHVQVHQRVKVRQHEQQRAVDVRRNRSLADVRKGRENLRPHDGRDERHVRRDESEIANFAVHAHVHTERAL